MDISNQRIPVVDFCNSIKSNEVRINRDYQRSDKVWPPAAKSFLIETILLDYPIPKLLLSQHTDLRTRRSHKEIVDGQQRSRAILSYFDGEFRISKNSEEDRLAGRSLEELEEEDRKRFLDYGLAVDLMVGATPDQIRETFRRINSYTVPLNPEEHRHAVFQGAFKWFMHDLTKRFDESFIRIGLFDQKALVRMKDAKLLCEIIHGILHGIVTTSKKHLDALYKSKDKEFPEREDVDRRLAAAMDFLLDQTDLHNGALMKPYLVYSLLLAIVQVMDPVTTLADVFDGRAQQLDRQSASARLSQLAEALDADSDEDEFKEFVDASSSRTNVAKQRRVRTERFCKALIGL